MAINRNFKVKNGLDVAGTVTATTFVGDGSQLEGVSGGITYITKNSNYTAVAMDGILADTSLAPFTITLPSTPSVGDAVVIADSADFGANNLTVARNGETIEGDAEDLVIDVGGISVTFVYDGTTWQLYTQAGILTASYPYDKDYGLITSSPTAMADYGALL